MATDVARLSLDISVNGAKRAQSAMESLQSGSVRLTRATQEQIAAQNRLNSTFTRQSTPALGRFGQRLTALRQSFKLQKGAVQQAGFQFQDFAVQVGAGQSALVAFSQQGSQLAGILGPGGAVLGAVIAIGAALAGPFVRGMMESERETKSLIDRIEGLEVSYEDLNGAIKENLRLEKARAEARIENQIAEVSTQLRIAEQRVKSYSNALSATGQAGARFSGAVDAEELKTAQENVVELGGDLGFLGLELDETRARYDKYISGTEDTGDSAGDAAEKIREMVQAAEQQAATIGLSARAIATYEAAIAGANAEQILAIDTAFRRIEAHKAEAEAAREAAKEEEKAEARRRAIARGMTVSTADDPLLQRVEAEKRANDIIVEDRRRAEQEMLDATRQANAMRKNSFLESAQVIGNSFGNLSAEQKSSMSAIGGAFDNLQSIMQAGGEKSFQAYKRLAQTEAAIAGSLAVVKALGSAPPPFNIALATTIGALTAVEIAAIDQQQYQGGSTQSFEGGGFTGSGTRSGGVDGKGGFPAILHPNETVIDHEMGQRNTSTSNSTNVTQVFQLSDNARREAKQAVLESAPFIRQQAKAAVLEAIGQGGSMSRAVGRRS